MQTTFSRNPDSVGPANGRDRVARRLVILAAGLFGATSFQCCGDQVPVYEEHKVLNQEQIDQLAAQKPFLLGDWVNHGPIGQAFVCGGTRSPSNLWGYGVNRKTYDLTTEAGLAQVRSDLLLYADRCIANLKGVKGQGIIVWDFDGTQHGWPGYIGDPPGIPTFSALILPIADDFFQKFHEAGLAVGVCIRGDLLVLADGKPRVCRYYQTLEEAIADLDAKITFAVQRWGAKLFYIDSYGDGSVTGSAVYTSYVFEALLEKHPGILLIPEAGGTLIPATGTINEFNASAPLNILCDPRHFTGTPSTVRAVYPGAFCVINISDADVEKDYDEMVKSFTRGDIPLFRCWFQDHQYPYLQRIENSIER
jgi:hypothetical protein